MSPEEKNSAQAMSGDRRPSPYPWLTPLMIVMAVVALAIGGLALHYIETRLVAVSGETLALAASDIAGKLDLLLAERYGDIQIIAQAPAFRSGNAAVMTRHLNAFMEAYPVYVWMGVTDRRGRVIAATNPASVGVDRSRTPWFQTARDEGHIHVEDADVSEESDEVMAVSFTAPLTSPDGAFLGAVTTRVGLPVLEDVFAQTANALQAQYGTGTRIEYQFLRRDGTVIADSFLREKNINLKQLGLPSAGLYDNAPSGYVEEQHLRRRVPVVTGYAQTEQHGNKYGLDWGVLIRMDREDLLAPTRMVLWKVGAAGTLMFAPMLGFLLWSTSRLRREWGVAQEEAARATKAEAVVRKNDATTRHIMDATPDALVIVNEAGRIVMVNTQAERLFGYRREELLDQEIERLLPDRFHGNHHRHRRGYFNNPQSRAMGTGLELYGRRKDGHEFPVEISLSPLETEDGGFAISAIRDITMRKQAESALSIAKEAADAANRAKSEFLASMSHEIRTPMNAIIGMADLLAETPLTHEQKEYVQIFRRAGGTLLTLINDILDLSKVEAGHMELEEVDFDLNDVVEKAMEVVAIRAHDKGLELTCHVMPDVPTDLVGDPTRLRQVLLNLLGNAVKFTESGEVVLRMVVEPGVINHVPTMGPLPEANSVVLRFSISDTGIGIPSDKLGTIFERFTQADSSTTRRYGGTGLGLTISKRLVELMGGHIEVESIVGHGTTFSFTLRAGVWTGPKRRMARLPVGITNLNTLVVDDNATNRLILREMLAGWKARVTEAASGEEALARLQRAQDTGDPYRLVLLDCRMPGMDGFQVVDATKSHPGLANVTIMMLTSDGRGGDLARARELGLAAYMVKPVKRADLLNAISAALSMPPPSKQEAPPAMVQAPPDVQPSLRILLVEDAADNRLLIQAYLKHTAHRLDMAENGEVACGKYKSGRYDLVFMDMQMPVMDGYAATQAIREWERANHRPPTPIIALTAHALKGDEEKSLAAGCTAHLTKPIKKAALLAAILEQARSPAT